jgi:hypothetical protein
MSDSEEVQEALARIQAAETEEEAIAIEAELITQSDNRPTEEDPE